jgi:hypothetical protein
MMGQTGAIVVATLAMASLFIQNFWCRYLCPYGALLGLTSWLSPLRIRRDAHACIDCSKCAKPCPSALPVDKLVTIKSAECTGCLECFKAHCTCRFPLRLWSPSRNGGAHSQPGRWRQVSRHYSWESLGTPKFRVTGILKFPPRFIKSSCHTPMKHAIPCPATPASASNSRIRPQGAASPRQKKSAPQGVRCSQNSVLD